MKVCGAYRQPAGIGPPNTLSASATMRVSETIFRSPERCSSVITGSRLLIASIWPERIAATAPLPAPTPMIDTSLGFSPALASTKFAITLVDEPGAVTPIFLPFRSATVLKFGIVFGLTPSTICGARPCSTKARRRWPLACMLMVCSKAPETTSALPPTTACSARAPPAKSAIVDVEPFGLEVAERLGDRQRQVVQQVLAADRDRDLRLLERLRADERGQASAAEPASAALDQARRCMRMSPVCSSVARPRRRAL